MSIDEKMQHRGLVLKENVNCKPETLVGLCFVLPYIERFIGGTWYIDDNTVGRAIILVECLAILAGVALLLLKPAYIALSHLHRIEIVFCFYVFASLVFNTGMHSNNISTAIWMIVPILFAAILHSVVLSYSLDIKEIIRYGMWFFMLYACLLVAYNILVLKTVQSGGRLVALAGGPVVFGYTLAVYFALLISYKQLFKRQTVLCFKIVLTAIAVMTGSRGSVWPILALWLVDFLRSRLTYRRFIVIVITLGLLIVINPIDLVYQMMPRLFDGLDNSRMVSGLGAIEAFRLYDPLHTIIGCGPGDFFPYQAWVSRNVASGSSVGNINNFTHYGIRMLVQPHNTYIYYLLELGLAGIALFGCVIIKSLKINYQSDRMSRIIIIGTIAFVNLFDSVFIVEPGVAGVLWFILMLVSSYENGKSVQSEGL